MLVTGVLLRVTASAGDFLDAARDAGIGDSKSLCAHGDMAAVESFVLAMLAEHLGHAPASLDALYSHVSLLDDKALRDLCPEGEAPRACFAEAVALPAFGEGISADSRKSARALGDAGVRLVAARSVTVCARRLNVAREAGRSRFDLDLDAMLDLVVALRAQAHEELRVVCGKVGGRKAYAAAMTRVHPLPETLEETPARSAYRLRGVGEVAFARDADASDPAVALASLVGKYLRELTVERIYRYYAKAIPGLTRASGYHDPVTARFVEATRLVRGERAIGDDCFER
jgi:hypothetical protein